MVYEFVFVVPVCGEYKTMFSNVKLWLEMQQSPKGKVHKNFVKGIELLGNEDTKQHTPSMTFG